MGVDDDKIFISYFQNEQVQGRTGALWPGVHRAGNGPDSPLSSTKFIIYTVNLVLNSGGERTERAAIKPRPICTWCCTNNRIDK